MLGLALRGAARALRLALTVFKLPVRVVGLGLSSRTWFLFYTGYVGAKLSKGVAKRIAARRDAFDGLSGIVSFSACLIAGGLREGG
jgi:hypothetical protein